jgi:malate synthase
VSESLVRGMAGDCVAALESAGQDTDRLSDARKVFEEVALSEEFVDFLTLPAYELIN